MRATSASPFQYPLPSLASNPMFKLIDVEQTVAEVTSGAVSDDEQLRAFHARLVTTLKLPVLGLLGGRRVQIVTVEYLGNPRRGITLRAFEGDRTVTASILDLTLPGKSAGALTLAGLKRWAGIPDEETARHEIEPTRGEVVAAYVAKVGSMHLRLRVLGSPQEITYRSSGSETLRLVPGHVVRVKTNKRWTHRGAPYMSGEVIETRVDAAALSLPPLALREEGTWDPLRKSRSHTRARSRSCGARWPHSLGPSTRCSRCCRAPIPTNRGATQCFAPQSFTMVVSWKKLAMH